LREGRSTEKKQNVILTGAIRYEPSCAEKETGIRPQFSREMSGIYQCTTRAKTKRKEELKKKNKGAAVEPEDEGNLCFLLVSPSGNLRKKREKGREKKNPLISTPNND